MKKFIMIIMAVALFALPTMAQQQEWQSTSAMQGTGSSYSPQVTVVGATSVGEMATTTSQPASNGPRRAKMEDDDWGNNPQIGEGNEGSPIGDALIPLSLMAIAFCAMITIRRRRLAKE